MLIIVIKKKLDGMADRFVNKKRKPLNENKAIIKYTNIFFFNIIESF